MAARPEVVSNGMSGRRPGAAGHVRGVMHNTWRVAAGLSVLCGAMLPVGQAVNRPVAELPLEFDKNLPLVSLRVNDSPLTFILDSASRDCVIDDKAAADAGIDAPEPAFSSGSGGMVAVKLARGVKLR